MTKTAQWRVTGFLCLFVATIAVRAQGAKGEKKTLKAISWSRCLGQKSEFYASDEAVRTADNVLLYQQNAGGWQKKWVPRKNVLRD